MNRSWGLHFSRKVARWLSRSARHLLFGSRPRPPTPTPTRWERELSSRSRSRIPRTMGSGSVCSRPGGTGEIGRWWSESASGTTGIARKPSAPPRRREKRPAISRAPAGAHVRYMCESGGSASLHHRLISLKPPAWRDGAGGGLVFKLSHYRTMGSIDRHMARALASPSFFKILADYQGRQRFLFAKYG